MAAVIVAGLVLATVILAHHGLIIPTVTHEKPAAPCAGILRSSQAWVISDPASGHVLWRGWPRWLAVCGDHTLRLTTASGRHMTWPSDAVYLDGSMVP